MTPSQHAADRAAKDIADSIGILGDAPHEDASFRIQCAINEVAASEFSRGARVGAIVVGILWLGFEFIHALYSYGITRAAGGH